MVHPIGGMLVRHLIRLQAGLIVLRWRAWMGRRERVQGTGSLAAGEGVSSRRLAKRRQRLGSRRVCRGRMKGLRRGSFVVIGVWIYEGTWRGRER